ncbi:adenylate cyclase NT domain protein, partial [Vibrio parahaemolyticus V-223/04]
LPAI